MRLARDTRSQIKSSKQDRHVSGYDIPEELDVDHKTVLRHLQKSGYKKKLDIWLPQAILCSKLNNSEPFLT